MNRHIIHWQDVSHVYQLWIFCKWVLKLREVAGGQGRLTKETVDEKWEHIQIKPNNKVRNRMKCSRKPHPILKETTAFTWYTHWVHVSRVLLVCTFGVHSFEFHRPAGFTMTNWDWEGVKTIHLFPQDGILITMLVNIHGRCWHSHSFIFYYYAI